MKPELDIKRTVRAAQSSTDDDRLMPGESEYTEPGLARRLNKDHLLFSCPGCGRPGAIRADHPKSGDPPSWDVTGGTLDDVTTLTLAPSIHCVGCCGWHGFLRNGVFESC